MTLADDYIEHFGIKGMKWGVRKNRSNSSTKPKMKVSTDAAEAAVYRARVKSGSVASLDNKELQALVTRMNLEQQYSNLTIQKKKRVLTAVKTGKEYADTTMSFLTLADKMAGVPNSPSAKLGKQVMTAAFNYAKNA